MILYKYSFINFNNSFYHSTIFNFNFRFIIILTFVVLLDILLQLL